MLKQLVMLWLLVFVAACSDKAPDGREDGIATQGFELPLSNDHQMLAENASGEFSLIRDESFGGLKLDMSIQEFEPLLPCSVEKGEPVLWAGIGEIIQEWNYQDCGVKLQLSTVDPDVPQIVSSIIVRAPSELATTRNIKIGSSEEDILTAYADFLDEDYSVPGDTLVAGSIYGGIIFTLKDNYVESMFLGAGAE